MRAVTRLLPILPNLLLEEESDGGGLVYTGPHQTQVGGLERAGPDPGWGCAATL